MYCVVLCKIDGEDYLDRIMSYSESWAELMEIEIDKIGNPEEAIQQCAKAAADEADYDRITGCITAL